MALLPSSGLLAGIFVDNPVVQAIQYSLMALAALHVFIVFWATRDALRRTHSLVYQIVSILLVAALPVVGFFAYLLIRPSRTLSERNMEKTLEEILRNMSSERKQTNEPTKKRINETPSKVPTTA